MENSCGLRWKIFRHPSYYYDILPKLFSLDNNMINLHFENIQKKLNSVFLEPFTPLRNNETINETQ